MTRKKIAEFEEAYIIESDSLIFDKLLALPEVLSADTVFAYFSMGREVDTRKFISFWLSKGNQLALPIINGYNLEFALVDTPLDLIEGPYGIPSPSPGAKRVSPSPNDAVLVPALCYDENLFRLGKGGGYYDRFLAECPAVSIGLCRDRLIFPELPLEIYDIPVSLLVSENRKRGP